MRVVAPRPAVLSGRCLTAVLALAIALSACGGAEPPPPDPKIPAGLARDLAAQARAVAASLDAGDTCGAKEEALALQADVLEAIDGGRIPPVFRRELQSTAAELAQIECIPPELPPEPPDCAALEERKQELEAEKEALEGIEDEEERKAQEQAIEAELKALEEQLQQCEQGGDDEEGDEDDD